MITMSDNKNERELFEPASLGPIKIRNRTIRSAAFEGMCPNGKPSDILIEYHTRLARGGIGMTTVAYASVTRDGLAFEHQLWMRKEIIPLLKDLTESVHREGAAVSVQLGHCGNMADSTVTGTKVLAPSRVFNLFGLTLPEAMNDAKIEGIADAFRESALIAKESGFDAVEIQAGHGYLISQFLSPYTNRRKDKWGGNLNNRARFLLLVVDKVKADIGNSLALVVKMNLHDGFEGGMEIEDALEIAKMLEEHGVDGLVLSGGFVSKCPMYIMRGETPLKEFISGSQSLIQKIGLALFGKFFVKSYPFSEAYFLEDAMKVRRVVKIPLVLVGGMRSLKKMEEVLESGIDFIGMARPLIIEPDFVNLLRTGKSVMSRCEPCNKCVASMYHGKVLCPLSEEKEN